MRVLILGYRGNPYCGGQGIYMYNLIKELHTLGCEIDLVVGPPYPDPLDQWATVHKIENLNMWAIRTEDIPLENLQRIYSPWNFIDYLMTRFHFFTEMETYSMRTFFYLRKLLKTKSFDIIHDVQSLGWGYLPMKGYGIPMVTTVHHPLTRDRDADLAMDKTFWDKFCTLAFYPLNMQRYVIKKMDRVITSFKEGVDELNNAFGLKKEKASVVYNGMDVKMFQNTGEKRQKNSLLFVGNTEDHKKGLTYLLEALSLLPKEITLTIVDDGPPNKLTASQQIAHFNMEDRVHFTGKVSHERLVSLYSTCTILVMSSLYEGFGLPAAEAMACKTPVVATTAGALKEIIPPQCGITVEPRNPVALKDAVIELLKDDVRRQRMGNEGRKWTVSNYAWPVAAKNTYDVYKDVIEEYRSRK